MALYTYRCDPCKHEFETEHSVTAPKGAMCPKCDEKTENRLIGSATSFVLKGDTLAKDLYASPKDKS